MHGKTSEEQSFVDRAIWALFCSFVGECGPCTVLYSLVRCMYMSPGLDLSLFHSSLLFSFKQKNTNLRTFHKN